MAKFEVLVYPVEKIEPHPNADRLDLVVIGDYRSIVKKGEFQVGDLIAYIPEGSLVPQPILEDIGLVGKLAGPKKNRVKAIRLRNVLSQGICYPACSGWVPGQDVADELGVTKYIPTVPASFGGEVDNYHGLTLKYDIENFKKYPDVLQQGEEVVITEKIHGTWVCFGLLHSDLVPPGKSQFVVTSKGLSSQGLGFKVGSERNAKNLYVRAFNALGMAETLERFQRIYGYFSGVESPVYILGEIFGQGIQDLTYGANSAFPDQIGFRVFDIYVGVPGKGKYLDFDSLCYWGSFLSLEMVPVLYRGPFSKEKMLEMTDGKESVTGKETHIREGVVVRPVFNRRDSILGRVQLKSVSDQYLTRKGNVTEYD